MKIKSSREDQSRFWTTTCCNCLIGLFKRIRTRRPGCFVPHHPLALQPKGIQMAKSY